MSKPGLQGRTVLITGANNPHGIGAAAAHAFARAGCSLFLHYFRGPLTPSEAADTPGEAFYRAAGARSAQEIVESIKQAGGKADCWEADLAEASRPAELFDRAEAFLGSVQILVNNAAHCSYDTFLPSGVRVYGESSPDLAAPLSAESHDLHFLVNSRAPALLMAEFARRHVSRDATWGRIINISTDASSAHPGAVSYGASKHALESYSRAAAYELGRFGITVNIVAPGPTQTGWMPPPLEAEAASKIPLGRVGTPSDIAYTILFLASDEAGWVTGQTVYAGGGNVMPM
jgi:3-oxoacyl-[acyl-carrier protein] reductase